MPEVKKTKATLAKKTAAKKTEPYPWVISVMRDALENGEYWTLGQIARTYSQFELAMEQSKGSLARRHWASLKELAALHITRAADAAYKKKRDALMATAKEGKVLGDDLTDALAKLHTAADRARKKALEAAGVPLA